MPDWVWIVGFVFTYIILVRWVLPKLGIPT